MNAFSRYLSVPTPRRMLTVGGIAGATAALGAFLFFVWFDGTLATARALGSMASIADRLAGKGQLADAENLLRAALDIEEEHVFKVPFGVEARFDDELRRDFVTVLRKEGREREADAVAAGKAQP